MSTAGKHFRSRKLTVSTEYYVYLQVANNRLNTSLTDRLTTLTSFLEN